MISDLSNQQLLVLMFTDLPSDIYALGHACAVSGRRDEARQGLDELLRMSESRYVPPSLIGFSYISLDDSEAGFAWLERAYEERDFYLIYLGIDPRFTSLHADLRFMDLMHRMRLRLPSGYHP